MIVPLSRTRWSRRLATTYRRRTRDHTLMAIDFTGPITAMATDGESHSPTRRRRTVKLIRQRRERVASIPTYHCRMKTTFGERLCHRGRICPRRH